jgi:hypothetical protein
MSIERLQESQAETAIVRPHTEFGHPADLLANSRLSKNEKQVALKSLEQDARQLAVASEEGMAGGEATNLREVLIAERMLEIPAEDPAFTVVMQKLRSSLLVTDGPTSHGIIFDAIEALNKARATIRELSIPAIVPGVAEPGSSKEIEEELEKERLDP